MCVYIKSLELELEVAVNFWKGCWELNHGSIQEHLAFFYSSIAFLKSKNNFFLFLLRLFQFLKFINLGFG